MKQQLPAAAPCHPGDRRWRWSKQLPTGSGAQGAKLFCQESSCRRRGSCRPPRQSEQTGSRVGDEPRLLSESRFFLEKPFVAPVDQMLDHRVIRAISLNQHLTRFLSTAGPACKLEHELQSLLTSPQIRTVQKAISRKHCSQRDLGQIHPLGQHLSADQDISFTLSESSQQAPVSVPPSR